MPLPSPYPLSACGTPILVPSALALHSKILDLSVAPAPVLAAAPTTAPSLGRRLEVAPATVSSAVAAAVAVAWQAPSPADPGVPGA